MHNEKEEKSLKKGLMSGSGSQNLSLDFAVVLRRALGYSGPGFLALADECRSWETPARLSEQHATGCT